MSAHILGFSHEQFPHFGAALRIAQSLGLQRLSFDPDLDNLTSSDKEMSASQKEAIIRREIGRRLWAHILIQDWLAIPSSGMYSCNKKHFTTIRPRRLDDLDMTLVDGSNPIWADYRNYLLDVGSLWADFHDAITSIEDADAKYDQLLSFDRRLRGPDYSPERRSFFAETSDTSLSSWIRWARRAAVILHADRLIVLHRGFLGKSFTDPRYTYSRWASITAAKFVVHESEAVHNDAEYPIIWTNHGHLVTAGITLCLDVIRRSPSEPEYMEHRKLVERTISLLRNIDTSTLALRGVQMILSLMGEKIAPASNHITNDPHRNDDSSEQTTITWPVESRQDVDSSERSRRAAEPDGEFPFSASFANAESGENFSSIRASMVPGDADVHDMPLQQSHASSNNFVDNMPTADASNLLIDMSWNELFSDYYSTHLENAFLIEDLFPTGAFTAW